MLPIEISKAVEQAAKVIGKTWPLYSFVTSNPLTGYESSHFRDAVASAKHYLNAKVFPDATVFKTAFDNGEIDNNVLNNLLKENGWNESPHFYLDQMSQDRVEERTTDRELDLIMAKWLAAFMDEGLAEWSMPGKEEGFYKSWRKLAKYDRSLKIDKKSPLPENGEEALTQLLNDYPKEQWQELCTQHLAALPGWTGYINYRTEAASGWQLQYPIDLVQYLAVRLTIAKSMKINFLNDAKPTDEIADTSLKYIWLKAWERSWQNYMISVASQNSNALASTDVPDAQLVFCIDTRSELIRRHVEAQGNYETYGYAGFFGIAMDYTNLEDNITRKSCPPIVGSAYEVTESAMAGKDTEMAAFEKKNDLAKFRNYFLKRMKNMLPSTFGFVEGAGFFYGFSLLGRTLKSGSLYRRKNKKDTSFENITSPQINCTGESASSDGIPLADKVAIVKGAFDLTGWKKFAPLVVFAGHGSHTANNPFGSSLDCGACAASPGRHNARMLAKLANLKEVRAELAAQHQIVIPKETVFVGAEHNTTTDEIELFDIEVPASHKAPLADLKESLKKAQQTAAKNRLGVKDSVGLAEKKANNWSETRPEWGLAKNAGFIVAPRSLTKNENLHSRCFLHSYDWQQDITGAALEGIMQGPMVVTQWINNHYYFSTVDNKTFGGGTKITQNVTGRYGVLQGNGGDLKMGLPLQSVSETDSKLYHQPLRLSVLINAPLPKVIDILSRNAHLQTLLDNEWIYLMVMDPTDDNSIKTYEKGMQWSLSSQKQDAVLSSKTPDSEMVVAV
ncbi:hypothetical protein LX97_02949 [Nonlabens dokdonensis]|uniref:Probable inorganic carbon transporter subunit DabA n=2 Tax=Nonlabens dokdonensis TaxID=328515 RepID=L7WDU9_NONDD|nr:DUF2309 domain-containing protein [Nonlabens dokdonensis]AGC78259.1 hypothetical protein DDD_3132 [Nonlabens dokdonensis DSW-6]PZX37854.1 hypothetical protein LX97_02949 [Nonlabens dokdonensis]